MIDSHCHLDFQVFDVDRNAILARCAAIGIQKIIIPGTQAKSWKALVELCTQSGMLDFALGLHPYFIHSIKPTDIDLLNKLIEKHSQVVAVGEIGLDYFDADQVNQKKQLDIFIQQLNIASSNSLPIIIHHRRSHNEIIRTLKQQKFNKGGVVHAFSGSYQEAKSYLDLGFSLGFGGVITYSRANKTRDVLKRIPLSAVLLETDAPDMPIVGKQGERNSPEYLPEIAQHIANIKSEKIEQVIHQTTVNAKSLFAIDD